MTEFAPNLSALSQHQRALWPALGAVPRHFVLYGGTAIALRLGHRPSVDFDFMSHRSFATEALVGAVPILEGAERLQSHKDTLTVSVGRDAPVILSFFGSISFGCVAPPDRAKDNGIWIASLLDLAGLKLAVIQQRAEAKDYLDLHAIFHSGISLEEGLGAARALYGTQFNPAISLKALAYFEDGDLPMIPQDIKSDLARKAASIGAIPGLVRSSLTLAPEESLGV